MNSKILILIVAVIFLLTQIGCASLNKTQRQTTTEYTENTFTDFNTKMEKDVREWLLVALIVLGVAIALGASISAASGGNGFFLGISN